MARIKEASENPRVLIMYASTHGHTGIIATRFQTYLEMNGGQVEAVDVKLFPEVSAADYDAVIVGASIHAGHHQKEIVKWVKANLQDLDARPNALLSVSLSAAEDTEESREATQKCIADFVDETGWRPDHSEPVAGAIQYREYDKFTRLLIRTMMKHGGHPTDTSRDYVLTDWDALSRLADDLSRRFKEVPAQAATN